MPSSGAMRLFWAEARQARPAYVKYCELALTAAQLDALSVQERAAHDVAVFDAHLDLLFSIHQECGPAVDWQAAQQARPPQKPVLDHRRGDLARLAFQTYKPGLLQKWLGQSRPKVRALADAVRKANEADLEEFRQATDRFKQERTDWDAAQVLAGKVLAGDSAAYARAIKEAAPLRDFSIFGSELHFGIRRDLVGVKLRVHGKSAVPVEAKSLSGSGELSVEPMARSKWLKLYHDFVCASALRIGRELFALLPVATVLVNAVDDVLPPSTATSDARTILSVAFPRQSLAQLDWDALVPAAAMAHFAHRVSFKKTAGFQPVEPLSLADSATGALSS